MDYGTYLDLAKFKAEVSIPDTTQDTQLLRLLVRASRMIDNYCQRHFYMKTEAKIWRTTPGYWHSLPDLFSLTLSELNDVAIVEGTDFEIEPLFGYPKITMRMLLTTFSNRQKLELTGIWGYEESIKDTDNVQDNPLISYMPTLNVANGSAFSIGQTLKIESEQLYITSISSNALTVIRGVNGTTAAEHARGQAVNVYLYPDPIVQACFIQAIRWYRGRDAAWGDEVGIEGKMKFGFEPHPSVRVLLNPYRRIVGGF